jgi:hypothetical protein
MVDDPSVSVALGVVLSFGLSGRCPIRIAKGFFIVKETLEREQRQTRGDLLRCLAPGQVLPPIRTGFVPIALLPPRNKTDDR